MNKWVVLFLGIFFLISCGDQDDPFPIRSNNVDAGEDESHEGLILVHANNSFVVLGTDKKDAPANERPKMGVRFDYDFSIGKHEVTFGEFKKYVTEEWGNFSKSVLDSFPITDLTYFDAVLYANARSKDEGYDTAYVYSSVNFDEDGHCTEMEALVFEPDVDAYRLPTEAEWMLVASQGWDVEKAWSYANSDNHSHAVCTMGENLIGVCDMAGNAMEWVNDWMGIFKDTVVYNYAGGPDGGFSGNRIVKGGSYLTPKSSMNLYSRNSNYPVSSNSREDYVGFRLAFGRIPDVVWMTNDGVSVEARLISKLNARSIRSLVGTVRSKVAFRNNVTGNIAFVDYSFAPHIAVEIDDTLNCFHPDISPNGALVAFSTEKEGVSGKSSVYVRYLTVYGDSLVKLDVENASIPRWKVLPDGDTVIVYVTDAGNNADKKHFSSTSTWQVPFSKHKFGKPVKLYDGAYHGGISYDNKLTVTGSRLLRAKIADSSGTVMDGATRDTVWYGGEQACNVSLVSDSSKRTLFLDFGSDDGIGAEFVGHGYGVHEQLLIADSTGKLINSIPAPKRFAFDHTEWVTGGFLTYRSRYQNFIVTSLTNNNGAHVKISLVDLLDSSITDLVEGNDVWHPCFWVERGSLIEDPRVLKLDVDSAAIYYGVMDATLLAAKMNLFWYKGDNFRVVALGSSRMSLGFVSNNITYGPSFNMATIPSDMDVSRYLAVNYILNHCQRLKFLVVGLDLDLWSSSPGVNIKKNLLSVPGYFYDKNHDFWTDRDDYLAIKKLSAYYVRQDLNLRNVVEHMGWVQYEDDVHSWTHAVPFDGDSAWSDAKGRIDNALLQLTEIIEMAKEKNVEILGVIFPQSPYYKKTGAFGRHGMRRSHALQTIDRLRDMEKKYSNFHVMDENKMGDHDYPDSLAYDYDHLNRYGGAVITDRIDSALHAIGDR